MIGSKDKARAAVYTQLAATQKMGLSLGKAVDRLVEKGGYGALMLADVRGPLLAGDPVEEAFEQSEAISPLEVKVIAAGAKAGSLPQVLANLAERYTQRAATKAAFVGKLAYPVFLLHLAILFPSIPLLVSSGTPAFLQATLIPLAVGYGLVFGLYVAYRQGKQHAPRVLDNFLLRVPVVALIERRSSLADGLRALELLYGNGVPVLESLASAREVTPNVVVGDLFERLAHRLADGESLGEAVALEDDLPDYVIELIATGSSTGQLDDMLGKANERLEEEVQTARSLLVKAIGGIAFGIAALFVAYQVISFWSNLMNQVNKIGGG